jgi:signal transduction histidine kinase
MDADLSGPVRVKWPARRRAPEHSVALHLVARRFPRVRNRLCSAKGRRCNQAAVAGFRACGHPFECCHDRRHRVCSGISCNSRPRGAAPPYARYGPSFGPLALCSRIRFNLFLDQPSAITRTLDPHSPIPDGHRSYLLGLGVKTILIIPLTSRGQVNGRLTFRFTEERDFHPEELEIARALATQASLAIQLTRLAKTARQSAVLEERNQLAGEIHDSLAQFFTGISMQLGVAKEVIKTGDNNGLTYIERASELAQYGLADARRSAFSLRPTVTKESGLIEALQKVAERSNIPGSLRCNFRSHGVPEESLPPSAQQELLRIAQEAISNAVRHAKPTVISVDVRWEPPNLVLEVTDNGSGIANPQLASRGGFGLSNMRARAEKLGAQFDVHTAASRGTSIVVLLPIN